MLKLLVGVRSTAWSAALCLCAAVGAFAQGKSDGKDNLQYYVGSEACQPCHDDLYTAIQENPHGILQKNTRAQDHGCEACHGPGQAHVESNGDRSKILTYADAPKETVRERCRRCHAVSGDKPHVSKGVGCLSCHSIHHFQEKKALLVVPAGKLCQKCHSL